MSREQYSDHCLGCRPAIMSVGDGGKLGKPLPDDDPIMIAVNNVWNTHTTYQQRVAWHKVMCLNSRTPSHLRLAEQITTKMQDAMRQIKK